MRVPPLVKPQTKAVAPRIQGQTGRRSDAHHASASAAPHRSGFSFGDLRVHHDVGPPLRSTLTISSPGDAHEREADRLSEWALQIPGPGPPPRIGLGASGPAGPPGGSAIVGSLGPGQPLDLATRRFFEPRLGVGLGQVRVHSGRGARALAEALDALAFTDGQDLVFGAAQYAPGSGDGRRLLAHELAHVAQRRHGALGDMLYRKPKAIRFQDEPTLDKISNGTAVLAEGSKGEAVIRITTALSELGKYTNPIIDENFDPVLTSAVTAYQGGKGLTGKVTAGQVEKLTFGELDADFSSSYRVERDVASKQKAANLLSGTQSLDPAEKAASARAISTEVPADPVTHMLPKFREFIPGKGHYEARLTAIVDKEIVDEFNAMGKGRTAAHADPAKLYDWTQIEIIAAQAQKAVDGVFGQYYSGVAHPPLKKGVNLFDAFADKVATLSAGGKPTEDAAADWRVRKILTGDDNVAALDSEHGAIQSRAAEAAIVSKVKAAMIAKYRTELIETHKGWPGYASPGKIFIQLFKGDTANKQRHDMWDFFQTFIHEYIHTLENSAHVTYRGTMSEQAGDKTLREGVTDYFTKIVWNGITLDDALRQKIEGPFFDPANKVAVQPLDTYRESANAERLAGVVGLRNVMAAFFLGKVELIGKP